jgi:hypothetical protein
MLEFLEGNLLEAQAAALVNTVNTEGVMGKGIALQFSKKYPDMLAIERCTGADISTPMTRSWKNATIINLADQTPPPHPRWPDPSDNNAGQRPS